MIHANFGAVLDSCVLANHAVCDLFLRLAETPKLYVPYWNEEILKEVKNTHNKFKWPSHLSDSWQKAVREHFPESLVTGHERFMDIVKNDPKDRHVVAAACQSHSEVIVTFNLKHFPKDILAPHGVRAEHPSEFLINLYNIDGGIFVTKLVGIAENREIPVSKVLDTLSKHVPDFTEFISESAGL
ncbi:MAG TPA: PIN domain-containing protein [Pseudomonadales bacterium]|nr:PIN domain-containing protein [Pseudomonadales bacterium]